jgi:enamine deaminase RidA (YjgF/YER057c/UK114 family)
MGVIDDRIDELGLVLPPPLVVPDGVVLPFSFVKVVGDRALISGHGPQAADGSVGGPLGQVGADVTPEQAYDSARSTGLAIIGSLRRALGDLDRIAGWTRLFGMVNSAPGFRHQPTVINGCSDLIIEIFGPEVGAHTRSAVGMAALPFGIPVEIEGEVALRI